MIEKKNILGVYFCQKHINTYILISYFKDQHNLKVQTIILK